MKRGEIKSIADLVKTMCREEGLETPLNEYRLVSAWGKVLGSAVESYTKDLRVYNQVLYVTLSSSVLRQELFMSHKSLVRRLNEHVGAQVITDIILR